MTRTELEKRALSRRLVVVLLLGVTFFSFALLALSSWLFLRRMGSYLEDDRKRQLTATASLAARLLESRFYPVTASLEDDVSRSLIQGILLRVHVEAGLQAAYLIDPSFRVVLSSVPALMEGNTLSYLVDDSSAIRTAFGGIPASSALHVIGDSRFLNAYAPVGYESGRAELVFVAEASADFFRIIESFRGGLIAGAAVGVGLLVLFGIALVWGVRKLLQTEEALRQHERLATIGQMAASMAHEIRNPLGIIRNTAQILRRRYGEDTPDPLFDFIPEEVERLNRLVTDYLTLSREPKLEPRRLGVVSFVRRLVEAQDDQRPPIQVEIEDPDFKVVCDPDALERILLNLLRNAREASGEEGKIVITVSRRRKGGRNYLGISVRDSGPGLPEDVPPTRLFEPFFSTKRVGTGLGLAVSKALAEASGGWIEARNRKSGGAEVTVYLPEAESEDVQNGPP